MDKLEEQMAHLIRTVDDLSDVVARQETEIATLTRRVHMLMQREGEAFGSQMKSPEAMEAFMAFTQKRAPNFG